MKKKYGLGWHCVSYKRRGFEIFTTTRYFYCINGYRPDAISDSIEKSFLNIPLYSFPLIK